MCVAGREEKKRNKQRKKGKEQNNKLERKKARQFKKGAEGASHLGKYAVLEISETVSVRNGPVMEVSHKLIIRISFDSPPSI